MLHSKEFPPFPEREHPFSSHIFWQQCMRTAYYKRKPMDKRERDELKDILDEEDGAAGLQFSIDIELNNYKLTDKQRAAVRKMHMRMLVEVRTKMQLLVPADTVRVKGEVRSSASGKREVHPDVEAMNEA
jgi:hypothetical protein